MHLESLRPDAMRAGEAVRDAVGFMRTVERDAVEYTLAKADASPVTAADFIVQALVACRLARHFPGDPLVAEENSSALGSETARPICERASSWLATCCQASGSRRKGLGWIDRGGGACSRRFWTLDPVDGTKGLLGGGQYVIALALVIDSSLEIGILGCPRLIVLMKAFSRSTQAARGSSIVRIRPPEAGSARVG